jgi:hypothetical protein
MRNTLVYLALFWAALPACAQIGQPQLGYIRDSNRSLRPAMGIPAAATLGDAVADHVQSFACSATACLVNTDAALLQIRASSSGNSSISGVPQGPAVIAVDENSDDAWIYFQNAQQFGRWEHGALSTIDYSPGGDVLPLRATAGGFDYAVVRDPSSGTAWLEHVSTADGSVTVLDSIAATETVMLLTNGVVYAGNDQLILRRSDGNLLTFPLSGIAAFHRASETTVEIDAAGGQWLLSTVPGYEQLCLLPGNPEESAQ